MILIWLNLAAITAVICPCVVLRASVGVDAVSRTFR